MFARYELGEPIRVLDLGFEAMNFDAGPAETQNKRHPGGDRQKSRRGILLIRVCPVAAPNPKPVVRLYHTARASTRRQVRDHANQRAPGIRWADPGTGGRPPWGVGGRRAEMGGWHGQAQRRETAPAGRCVWLLHRRPLRAGVA